MSVKKVTKTHSHQGHKVQEDLEQTSKIGLMVIVVLGALVGFWGLFCLVGSLIKFGVGGVFGGLLAAITGR